MLMVEAMEIVQIVMAKTQSAMGASHHPKCLTSIHTC